jgi:hypothetical protein
MSEHDRRLSKCPLWNQTGEMAIRNFVALIESLPPELRAAFERERCELQAELDGMTAPIGGNRQTAQQAS